MPKSAIVTHNAPTAVINGQMKSVEALAAFLGKDEIPAFLQTIKEAVYTELEIFDSHLLREKELIASIDATEDYEGLKEIHDALNVLQLEKFLQIDSVRSIHQSCTRYRDALANKVLALAAHELHDKAPEPAVPFALISMGSDGREEQTLITDQDYLIVYGDDGGTVADEYFTEFSNLLVERLAQIGFKKCTGDMMPSNPTWRGSYSQWKKRLLAIVRYEYTDYAKNLMDLIVLSDARHVGGDSELADRLIKLIRGLEQDYFQVLWGMAKAATEMKVALGFLKRLWTEGSGDHHGEFNLKLLAWAPLVMNVRILSINLGIPATNTLQRIKLLTEEKSISPAIAIGLSDAYQVLTKHRILLQIKVIKGIQNDSYYLNPYQLTPDEREKIRQALLRIEELQKMIHVNFSIM